MEKEDCWFYGQHTPEPSECNNGCENCENYINKNDSEGLYNLGFSHGFIDGLSSLKANLMIHKNTIDGFGYDALIRILDKFIKKRKEVDGKPTTN